VGQKERSNLVVQCNSSFEVVEEFTYLGITLTNQKCIQEEIKKRLKPGNAFYQSVKNLLSSILLEDIKNRVVQNYNFVRCFLWV